VGPPSGFNETAIELSPQGRLHARSQA
jgi:hypothetical protein